MNEFMKSVYTRIAEKKKKVRKLIKKAILDHNRIPEGNNFTKREI